MEEIDETGEGLFCVYRGQEKMIFGLKEHAAKLAAVGMLWSVLSLPRDTVVDWTPRGHLFYQKDGAMVPSTIYIRPDGELQVAAKAAPMAIYSGPDLSESVRFLMTSPTLMPRVYTIEELVIYLRSIWRLEDDPGTEDDALWAILPGLVEPFRMFIAATATIEMRDGKPFKASSQLVIHKPLDEASAREGMEIAILFRNGLRVKGTLDRIEHSIVHMIAMEGREGPQTVHWTAIRALFERHAIGSIEWEV